ncbi:MAG: MBL fold metallo-hydrolase, partial [Deltaproteobacteria bacterium]|nr:MBL fold metallo-hydrolase [Deltaproteobacteria bacterium]
GAKTIVVTNTDHVRDAVALAKSLGAALVGPRGERDGLGWPEGRSIGDGDQVVPGLEVLEMHGSKTPGELVLVLLDTTLITGDLVRGQRGGRLNRLPAAKLRDPAAAQASIERLAALAGIEAVIVGDGWPVFRRGSEALRELAAEGAGT